MMVGIFGLVRVSKEKTVYVIQSTNNIAAARAWRPL